MLIFCNTFYNSFQKSFGECMRMIRDDLDYKNLYAYNPGFDKR